MLVVVVVSVFVVLVVVVVCVVEVVMLVMGVVAEVAEVVVVEVGVGVVGVMVTAGGQCIFCESTETNRCPTIRATQGQGKMPDGTTRFKTAADGTPIHHFMGCR